MKTINEVGKYRIVQWGGAASGRRWAEEGTREEGGCLGGMSEESSLIMGIGQRLPGSEQPLEQDLPVGTFLVCRQKNERVTQEQGGGHVAEVG